RCADLPMIPYESALLTISCGHIFLERFVKHGHYAGFYPLRCPGLSSAWSLQHGVWMLCHDQNSLIYMHFHVVHFGSKHEISSKQHNGKVSPLSLMAGGGQTAVQVIGGADQGQVSKRLREVPQVFAARSQFLGVEAEVVGISQGLLEEEAGLFQIPGPRQALHIPERAHGKGALLAQEPVP